MVCFMNHIYIYLYIQKGTLWRADCSVPLSLYNIYIYTCIVVRWWWLWIAAVFNCHWRSWDHRTDQWSCFCHPSVRISHDTGRAAGVLQEYHLHRLLHQVCSESGPVQAIPVKASLHCRQGEGWWKKTQFLLTQWFIDLRAGCGWGAWYRHASFGIWIARFIGSSRCADFRVFVEVLQSSYDMYHRGKNDMVDHLSALGLRHVGYGVPIDLFGPFCDSCVQVIKPLIDELPKPESTTIVSLGNGKGRRDEMMRTGKGFYGGFKIRLVGALEHFLFFHVLGIIIPTDELIFFRGVGIPPTRILLSLLSLTI